MIDVTVGIICVTALVIAWLGRGAHDLRLRAEAQRLQAGDVDAVTSRVATLERRVEDLDKTVTEVRSATALARAGRR